MKQIIIEFCKIFVQALNNLEDKELAEELSYQWNKLCDKFLPIE